VFMWCQYEGGGDGACQVMDPGSIPGERIFGFVN
jgi:hypothetical protein